MAAALFYTVPEDKELKEGTFSPALNVRLCEMEMTTYRKMGYLPVTVFKLVYQRS